MAQNQIVSPTNIRSQITQLRQTKVLSPAVLSDILGKVQTALDLVDLRFRNLGSNQLGTLPPVLIEGLHVKNLSADQITTGTLIVGGNGSDPQLSVVNASGVEVGWIGVRGVYSGAWFSSLYIGGTGPADAKITANSGAVTINGATFTLNLNNVTTTIDNSLFSGQYTGLRIQDNATGAKRVQSAYFSNAYNAAGNPMTVIAGDGTDTVGKILVCNGTGTGGIDGIGTLIGLDGGAGRVRVQGNVLIENGNPAQDLELLPSAMSGSSSGFVGYMTFKLGGTDYKLEVWGV